MVKVTGKRRRFRWGAGRMAVIFGVILAAGVLGAGALLVISGYRSPGNEITSTVDNPCQPEGAAFGGSGVYVLESGEEAFLVRAEMLARAQQEIDILTFIWSTDRIGNLFASALIEAAERGVQVRIVVDDFFPNENPTDQLIALSFHSNIQIRIYNPVITVGVSPLEMVLNVFNDFRRFNQRLHNKSLIVDGRLAITGGRNMADEYFDYNPRYNFLDREVLVRGAVVESMKRNFADYWADPLVFPIETLEPEKRKSFSREKMDREFHRLRSRAADLARQIPIVKQALEGSEARFSALVDELTTEAAVCYVSDRPGKNLGRPGLDGNSSVTLALRGVIANARERITIQSPYFVLPDDHLGLKESLRRDVEIRVSTNSLAATDNIPAFSGYYRDRRKLLDLGFRLAEFRPGAGRDENRHRESEEGETEETGRVFMVHGKTLVIDGEYLFIGTFNIDPRSVSLNTEEGVLIYSPPLARQVENTIFRQMEERSSWNPEAGNPEQGCSWQRRWQLELFRVLPIRKLL